MNSLILILLSVSMLIFVFFSNASVSANSPARMCEKFREPRCSPIVPLPNSASTYIRKRMVQEDNFEFAILETSPRLDGYFLAYIIREIDSSYKIYCNKISLADVTKNNIVDPVLVDACDVSIASRVIDNDSVMILADTLRNQVSKAKFHDSLPEPSPLDGTKYEVFVKGTAADIYQMYAGEITDGFPTNSYSLSTISAALEELMLLNDVQEPIIFNKLIHYLSDPIKKEDSFAQKVDDHHEFTLPSD